LGKWDIGKLTKSLLTAKLIKEYLSFNINIPIFHHSIIPSASLPIYHYSIFLEPIIPSFHYSNIPIAERSGAKFVFVTRMGFNALH